MNKDRFRLKLIVLLSIFVFITFICLMFGSSKLSFKQIFEGLFSGNDTVYYKVMRYVRIPRVASCIVAGCGLSMAGYILQSVTNNNLASPNIIGVNSGAGLFVILLLFLLPGLSYLISFAAFIGGFITTILIISISKSIGHSKITIILVGISVTTIFNSVISFITLLDSDLLVSYNYFSIGGLGGVSLHDLIIPSILIAISFVISYIYSSMLDIMQLGDDVAISLGVNVKRIRFIMIVCASLACASVVSFAGLLGFIGLIVPNITKRVVGNNSKKCLLSSLFIGSCVLLLADLFGRTLFAPSEIPVGIVMALVGSPVFLYILIRGKKND